MRWEMEMEEVEAVLERIWDLHDKISDAIHAISRAHFLSSVKGLRSGRQPPVAAPAPAKGGGEGGEGKGGFVFVKDFRVEEDGAAMAEARSLNDIRSALENLEDQLEFFHTVQSQQRAERDAAIARLEQSRIILAIRLAEHRGKKYKVIEEALAFVGDVHNMGHFVMPETLYENEMTRSRSGKNLEDHESKGPSMLMQMFISSFAVAKRSFGLVGVQGILGNAAMFAVSMLALVHLNQVAFKGETAPARDQTFYRRRNEDRFSRMDNSSHSGQLKRLDVLWARG
ncbi:plastid division protein PDV1 [Musa acuminata AAA Group]|uniref:plastid division protein PDV1 n=1 Tax=Musa acuminata AAA Group TaxID=214697 RepID=UPI0031CDFED3